MSRETALIQKGDSYTLPAESESLVVATGWEGTRVQRAVPALIAAIVGFTVGFMLFQFFGLSTMFEGSSTPMSTWATGTAIVSAIIFGFSGLIIGIKTHKDIDLDMGVLVFDDTMTFVGWCNFENGHHSFKNQVIYSGDDRQGDENKMTFNEAMWLRPTEGYRYAVVLNTYSGDRFVDVQNGLVAVFNADFDKKIDNPANYVVNNVHQGNKSQLFANRLDKFSPNTKTVLLGSLMKVGESWVYRVINKTFPVGRVCSENQVVKIISHELS
jgi:stress response protein SCP2